MKQGTSNIPRPSPDLPSQDAVDRFEKHLKVLQEVRERCAHAILDRTMRQQLGGYELSAGTVMVLARSAECMFKLLAQGTKDDSMPNRAFAALQALREQVARHSCSKKRRTRSRLKEKAHAKLVEVLKAECITLQQLLK